MPQSVGLNLIAKILDEGRLSSFYGLKREYFYGEELAVFDRVAEHVNTHGVLPSVGLLARQLTITDPDTADPFGVWHDEYIHRALHNTLSEALPALQRDLESYRPAAAYEKLAALVESARDLQADGARDLSTAPDIGEAVLAEFRRLREMRGMSGIPSNWPTLDATTKGFQPGDLIVFAARPGVGKSTLAIKLALEAYRAGVIPLVVSMEMSKVQLGARLMGIANGLSMVAMKGGQLSTFAEHRITETISEFRSRGSQPFYMIEGQFRQNINELAALVHSLRPGFLIVDGAYLLRLPNASNRMPLWEKIGEIAMRLKTIGSQGNIPALATFQINREGGKRDRAGKEMGVEHLMLSDTIGQLASLIVALFAMNDENELTRDRMRVMQILKGREGERGKFMINWDWERSDFSEVIRPATPTFDVEINDEDLIEGAAYGM